MVNLLPLIRFYGDSIMSTITLSQINAQIAELQKQAEQIKKAEFDSIVTEMKKKIAEYAITARDLGLDGTKNRKSEVAPKYAKNGKTWTGRGKRPLFVQEHLASGGSLDDLLIR